MDSEETLVELYLLAEASLFLLRFFNNIHLSLVRINWCFSSIILSEGDRLLLGCLGTELFELLVAVLLRFDAAQVLHLLVDLCKLTFNLGLLRGLILTKSVAGEIGTFLQLGELLFKLGFLVLFRLKSLFILSVFLGEYIQLLTLEG